MGKKKVNKNKGELINIKQKLFSKRFQDKKALTDLKYNFELEEIQKVLLSIPKTVRESVFFQHPLPKTFDLMGRYTKYYFKNNLTKEINWLALEISDYSHELNQFIKLQQQYETSFMLGDYNIAQEKLFKINDICLSMWGLEQSFLISEYMFGLEKNKTVLAGINKLDNLEPITLVLAEYLSNKAEKKMTINKYRTLIEELLERYKLNSGEKKIFGNFFSYKLDILNSSYFDDLSSILFFSGTMSIIDRYLALKRICLINLLEQDKFENKKIFKALKLVYDKIEDPEFIKIMSLYQPAMKIKYEQANFDLFFISDLFLKGEYSEVIRLGDELIQKYPNSFGFYVLFCLAKICNQEECLLSVNKDNNSVNLIVVKLCEILCKSSTANKAILELVKLSFLLSSFTIGFELFLSIQKFLTGNWGIGFTSLSNYFAQYFDARESFYYEKPEEKIGFLENLKKTYPDITGIKMWSSIITQCMRNKAEMVDCDIPDNQKIILLAKTNMYLRNYQDAIKIFQELKDRSDLKLRKNPILYEDIICGLFMSYIEISDYSAAAKLAVKTCIENRFFLYRFDLNTLVKKK